jgi:hypothetical protein
LAFAQQINGEFVVPQLNIKLYPITPVLKLQPFRVRMIRGISNPFFLGKFKTNFLAYNVTIGSKL